MHSRRIVSAVVLVVLLGLSACSHAPVAREGVPDAREEAELKRASLEISYVLGHSLHRFVTIADSDSVRAEAFRDQQLLKESVIDPGKYQNLMREASDLVTSLQAHPLPHSGSPCRTPFTLKIRSAKELRSIDGCRSSDAGAAVGRLIKNAEFLLYSHD